MGEDVPLQAAASPGSSPFDAVVNSRIAGYRLLEEIGRGGMAVVFRAHDERLDRQVAVKTLAPALAADEGFRQRFLRESVAAAAVDDPHIIPVFEAGEAAGVLFMAMRLVRGGDVRSLLRQAGRLAPWRVAALISPVASALDAAHAAGLVHRDVKPANMLLDVREGRPDHVYLSDFGLSRSSLSATGLTGSGQFLGTLDYVAPEQIEGGYVDGRADQYSLACTAFELLIGEPPFHRDAGLAVLFAQVSKAAPLLSARLPGAPVSADAVLSRAMAKVPADRHPSCREFADALRAALGIGPYDAGHSPRAVRSHPPTEIVTPLAVPSPAGQPVPAACDSRAATAAAATRPRAPAAQQTGDAQEEHTTASRGRSSRGYIRFAVPAAALAVALGAGAAVLASRPSPGSHASSSGSAEATQPQPAIQRADHRTVHRAASAPALVLARQLAAAGLNMTHLTALTAATDLNHLLGRQNGYTSKADWVDPAAVSAGAGQPSAADPQDLKYGGSIEVYPTRTGAQARAKYLKAIASAAPALSSDGYDYIAGTALLRLSNYLTPVEARRYHAAFEGVSCQLCK